MASVIAPTVLGDHAATHPYTCNSCQVAFRNSELQRGHMRSDWHRYNLKRRVTSLPPIPSEVFTEKVLQAQASSSAAATRASYERTCQPCAKTYFSENAFDNHLGSAKHRQRLASLRTAGEHGDTEAGSVISTAMEDLESQTTGMDSEAETEYERVTKSFKSAAIKESTTTSDLPSASTRDTGDTEDTDENLENDSTQSKEKVPLERCLFCNYDSPTIPLNVTHMERIHGMFIPERPYLVNLEGLIGSLIERIYEDHECLTCLRLKPTVFGLQTHMRDKGHCKISFDTEEQQLQVGEFYDFRSTYSDAGEDEEWESDDDDDEPVQGGAKLGAPRKVKRDGEDEEMGEGDGWETDSDESSLDSADLSAVPLDQRTHQYEKLGKYSHHSLDGPRTHRNKDGFHSHAHKPSRSAYIVDEYELVLPSGRAVGHRSLNKYYRQNLVSHPSPAERQERYAIEAARGSDEEEEEKDQRVVARENRERGRALASRANGGLGMLGVTAEKRKEVTAMEKRTRKIEEREMRKFQWGNNKQSNSQKHWRDHLLQ